MGLSQEAQNHSQVKLPEINRRLKTVEDIRRNHPDTYLRFSGEDFRKSMYRRL
jgi:hypothetical protein